MIQRIGGRDGAREVALQRIAKEMDAVIGQLPKKFLMNGSDEVKNALKRVEDIAEIAMVTIKDRLKYISERAFEADEAG